MKTFQRTWLLVAAIASLVAWTPGALAQQAPPGSRALPQEQFVCDHPGLADHRLIGIYQPGGRQHCRVDYTRDGRSRSLWSSGHDYRFCVRKALEIVRLLEGVNFKCTPHTEANGSEPVR